MSLQKKALVAAVVVMSLAGAVLAESSGKVNINTADIAQLELLPRVGPTVAQRIVEFREANGKFKKADELLLVRGIGEKTFELLSPYLAIDGETTLTESVSVPRGQEAESKG